MLAEIQKTCINDVSDISLLLKQLHENFRFKTHRCWKLSHTAKMQNDASWGHKGLIIVEGMYACCNLYRSTSGELKEQSLASCFS